MPRQETCEYAVYKGDEFICLGTVRECATYLGVKISTIRYLLSPAYSKRIEKRLEANSPLIAIKVDDE
ncbi:MULTISPECIES: hypothetical protein [Peribacillus]|uniref:hypothetical protein n=1 Tax=Peribacillus TaxID=2675229 RepID=UPI001E431996|nr:hypothetical protein [Peribacillus simplex]